MMRTPLAVFAVVATASVAVAGPEEFRWTQPIEIAELEGESLVRVPLGDNAYQHSQDDYADVRILDGDGDAVPYVIRKQLTTLTTEEEKVWTVRDVELTPQEDQRLEIRFTLPDDAPRPEGIRIVTPLDNFEQRIEVYAGPPGDETALVEEGLIFDYSRFMDVRRVNVPLPATEARRFRIVIGNLTSQQESPLVTLTRNFHDGEVTGAQVQRTVNQRPFRIDRVELWTSQATQQREAVATKRYDVPKFDVRNDEENHRTVVEIQTRRQPLRAFLIDTPDRNFSRNATLLAPDVRGSGREFRQISSDTLYRFAIGELDEEDLDVEFPVRRASIYRLTLQNGDNPPLAIENVTAIGEITTLIFLAAPEQHYRLAYGNEHATKPSYDTAALAAALREGIVPREASLGAAVENEGFQPGPAPLGIWDVVNSPIVIGLLVVVLAILLGWGLFNASKQIDQVHDESR